MESRLSKEQVEEAVRLTIEGNTAVVNRWLEGHPGSWGLLAGKAVTSSRQKLGGKLTDYERRAVWHVLWNSLTEIKEDS